jgi:(p)ppGpp synthase/HD superfamily hydrolase
MDIDLIQKAWDFAAKKHQDQFYGDKPYIYHIGAVVNEVYYARPYIPTSDDLYILVPCAILHDTIEDTNTTHQELINEFGYPIADGVLALTKDLSVGNKSTQLTDSLDRIVDQPIEIAIVKMADRITNLGEPPYAWDIKKIVSYHKQSIEIYDRLIYANSILAGRLKLKIELYAKNVHPSQLK